MNMEHRAKIMLVKGSVVGFFAGALLAGFGVYFLFPQIPQGPKVVRESDLASSTAYQFTDPLITVSTGNSNSPEYTQLQNEIQQYLNTSLNDSLFSASLRFSDIQGQEGFTINPDEEYDPASLTKIPLAMAFYALAENDPSVLSQTIYYSGDPNLDASEQIESPSQLTPRQTYTVEEMIEHMIKYSDNNSEQLLADHLSQIGQLSVLSSLFEELGINDDPNAPDNTTVGQYALFLRVLFNSTYLDRDYSEKLLQLMTEGDFTKGISAGVPSTIEIAQKFGDARIPNQQGVQVGAELQNCGIVYYPNHPYILCIMTKGSNVNELEQVIAAVSQMVYQNVSSKYPQS